MFLQDISRIIIGLVRFIGSFIGFEKAVESSYIPGRRKFLTLAATGVASVPFFTMIYGLTKGKYKYTIENIKLTFKDLPKSFEGLKIVQISDIHAGSFDSKEQVARGIDMINAQKPDLIVFTGDLVNSNKNEIDPYIDIFARLEAKMGKYAILGNHDYYGMYDLENDTQKDTYWKDFMTKYDQMGFKLLNNDRQKLSINNESISLVGVENWGAGRWFPKKGDLDKAMPNDNSFKILLSHDPTHWDEKVIEHEKQVHLTLSGHTHGFQFGINFPGFKWSPAQYRYKHWMGLYEEKDQYLYVNRGFGFLGFPGRVGMWPEIAVLELSSIS
jgi:predicted MPP superfamily phosphohydrolase